MGLLAKAKKVKEAGQGGDTELVHVNKGEKQILEKDLGKKATQNPKTGLPQYAEDLSAYDAAAKAYYEVNADLFKGVPYDQYMKAWDQSQGGLTAEQYKAYTTYLEQAKTGQDFDLYKGVITPQTLKDEQSIANAQAGSGPGEGEDWASLSDSDPLKINHMQDVQAQQQAAAVGGYSNLGQVQNAQFQKYGTDRLPGVFTNFLQKWLLPIALSAASFGVVSGIGVAGGAAAGGTTGGAAGGATGGAATGGAIGGGGAAAAIPEIVVTGTTSGGIGAGLGGAAAAAGAGAGAGVSSGLGASTPASGAPAAEPMPEVTVTGNPLPAVPTGGALAGDMLGAGIAGNIGAGLVSNGGTPAAESSEGMDRPFGDNPPTEDPGMSNPLGDNPNIGKMSGNENTLGGYLSKANDFLKTPIGQGIANIGGSLISGIGKGKEQQAEQDAINQRARYYDTQWRDPNQLAQLKAAVVDNTPISNGYLTRAKQVSDFLNSRQINTMQPGDPNKVYGSYVRGT